MCRLLKRGLFIMVVWGLPMVCVALFPLSLFCGYYARGYSAMSPIDGTVDRWFVQIGQGRIYWHTQHHNKHEVIALRSVRRLNPQGHFVSGCGCAELQPQFISTLPRRGTKGSMDFVALPTWPLLVPGFIVVAYQLFPGRRKRRRRKLGLCTRCGYDLRGQSDDSSGCPECGHPRSG